jgi:hypothetical protein
MGERGSDCIADVLIAGGRKFIPQQTRIIYIQSLLSSSRSIWWSLMSWQSHECEKMISVTGCTHDRSTSISSSDTNSSTFGTSFSYTFNEHYQLIIKF